MAEFRIVNRHLSEVSRFPATDGTAVDIAQLIRSSFVREDILTTYSLGALGAAISHIANWDAAIAMGGILTVCEDDAIFNLAFEVQAPVVIAKLEPGWDLILWGWNFDASLCFEVLPGVSSSLVRFEQDRLRSNCETFQHQSVDPRAFRLMSFFGLPCYTISPKGAAAFKARCVPLQPFVPCRSVFEADVSRYDSTESTGIDTAMNSVVSELSAYVCFPPLVVTKNMLADSTVQTASQPRDLRRK